MCVCVCVRAVKETQLELSVPNLKHDVLSGMTSARGQKVKGQGHAVLRRMHG